MSNVGTSSGAAGRITVSTTELHAAEMSPPITIGMTSGSGRRLGLGGLRCRARRKNDAGECNVAMPVLWHSEPDEVCALAAIVPGNALHRVVSLHAFEYVEADGTVTAIAGRVDFPAKFGLTATARVVAES
jgi:hypothetical protein